MIIYQYSRKFQRVIMYLLDSSPHVTWLKIVQHLWIQYCLSTMTQLSSYLPLPSRLRHHYNTAFIAYTKSHLFFTDELLNPKIAADTSVNHSGIYLPVTLPVTALHSAPLTVFALSGPIKLLSFPHGPRASFCFMRVKS